MERVAQTDAEELRRFPGFRPGGVPDYVAYHAEIDFLDELEAIWGEPLRRAQAAGVAMPELARLYEELRRLAVRPTC